MTKTISRFTLYERDENGTMFEHREFRRKRARDVFEKFISDDEIVRTQFGKAKSFYDSFCSEYGVTDSDAGEFGYSRDSEFLCDIEDRDMSVPNVDCTVKKGNWKLFQTFEVGNGDMPVIYYAKNIFPSWFGFESEESVNYPLMLKKISEKILVNGKYVPRFALCEKIIFFYFNCCGN